MANEGIVLNATLYKAQTMRDGGWRLTFDIPEIDNDKVHDVTNLSATSFQLVVIDSQVIMSNNTSNNSQVSYE